MEEIRIPFNFNYIKIGDKVELNWGTEDIVKKIDDFQIQLLNNGGFSLDGSRMEAFNPYTKEATYTKIRYIIKKKKSMKDKRNLELSLKEAKDIWIEIKDKTNSASIAMKKLILATYNKEELEKVNLPTGWEEVDRIYKGYLGRQITNFTSNKHIALIKLEILRNIYRQGWKPNWSDYNIDKYIIIKHGDGLITSTSPYTNYFLSFQSGEIAEEFLRNFKDLIKEAEDLI